MGPGDVAVSFDTAPTLTNPQQRRPTGPPMQPMIPTARPPASTGPDYGPGGPGMAFMSFPLGEAQFGSYAPPPHMATGYVGGGFGVNNFEDEPPLLEELGINIPQIIQKVLSVINPLRLNAELHEDGDLSGPIILCMLFGFFQLLAGKVHFGIILGWTSLAAFFLYSLFNFLIGVQSQGNVGLDLYRCCSVVGYSLLPITLFSALSLVLPHGNVALGFAAISVSWAARTCSNLLVNVVPQGEEQRHLVAYACFLVYATFSLLVLF